MAGQTAIYSARPGGATSVACEADTNADGVVDAFWTHSAGFTPGTGLALAVWDAEVDVTSVIVYTAP